MHNPHILSVYMLRSFFSGRSRAIGAVGLSAVASRLQKLHRIYIKSFPLRRRLHQGIPGRAGRASTNASIPNAIPLWGNVSVKSKSNEVFLFGKINKGLSIQYFATLILIAILSGSCDTKTQQPPSVIKGMATPFTCPTKVAIYYSPTILQMSPK